MQQNTPRSARRGMLAVLLVVALVLSAVYGKEGSAGPIHGLQDSVMALTGPALGAASGVGAANDNMGEALQDLTANPSSLSALREQNEELRRLLANAEEYRQEAERLQALLDMKTVSGVTGPTARIIGRSANPWDQSITINLGSANNLRTGMTVMGATGVIGQVSRVGENTATVRLLTDPDSGAAVMIQATRENAIVRGSISGVLFLEDLSSDYIPAVGDVVITSGLGGSYERGLIVGAIMAVNKSASNPTGPIIVNPNDKASVLEEVIVVFTAPEVGAAEKVAPPTGEATTDQPATDKPAQAEEGGA